jgi:glucosamine-phosphate N-acetyltransferase
MLFFKKISEKEYECVYRLLQELTDVGEYNRSHFNTYIDTLPSNIHIFCICEDSTVIGVGTIMIEQKIIHNFSKVGHIEDIVIDSNYNGRGYGKNLIIFLTNFARQEGCYKVILDCSQKVKGFYEKCGYVEKNISMGIYF